MRAPVYDKVLIGGKWVSAESGTYPITNPATEEPAGFAPECTVAQARAAAGAAREAFEKGPWPRMTGAERGRLLQEVADAFDRRKQALVELIVSETGALLPIAEDMQVGICAERLSKYARLAGGPFEEGLPPFEAKPGPLGEGLMHGLVVREPVGVVACISPFNFPLTNCAGKIGPALAMGNTVVVKPSPVDPLGVTELCRIASEVLPPGVLNYVNGSGPEVGEALTLSPDVDMISFTGSSLVGRRIQAAVGDRMKRTLMELGGKSANLVFADCDPEEALESSMSVWTLHSGQICTAPTRLLVEASLYDEFTSKLAARARELKIGDPHEEGVVIGPLVSAAQRERVERSIARGIEEGAKLVCGGKRPAHMKRGYYVEPTLFTQATNAMSIAREEIFGPVITAIPFRDEDEAVELANDSDYGLFGYVWSGSTARALRVARRLRTGTVQINGATPNSDAPFGGFKLSGIGRDGGRYGIAAYSELKAIGWKSS